RSQLHRIGYSSLVGRLGDADDRKLGSHLIAHGNDPAKVLATGYVDQQFGIDLDNRVRKVAQRGDPRAVNGLTSTAQRAVDRLDGIARGTHYYERNRVLVCQGGLHGMTLLKRGGF